MPLKTLVLAFMVCALVPHGLAGAQTPSDGAVAPAPATSLAPDYRIGPGDELSIRVSGVREFDQSIRVSNSGRIRVPFVGIVFAAGMTAVELQREIATKIRDQELVNEPSVRVEVNQHRAQPINIVGEVAVPGQFVLTGEMYVLDLITRAGGLTGMADGTAILYRRGTPRPSITARLTSGPPPPSAETEGTPPDVPPSSGAQVIPINLDELQDGTHPNLNVPLQGGDVLFVPRRQGRTFYIIGDVKAPGAYGMPRRGEVTAAQAIIYAGGPLMTAKNGSAFLMRHDASGQRQAIPIDFGDIIKGKKPDIQVQADDIIFIPNSAAKTIGVGLLNLVPRLLQQFLIF